ncbi:MAG TPA: hypothetical protein VFE63_16480 [Roseiarcus sp.]|nr:hypothetical protein [Roseiarcus sp.]
MKGNVVDKSVLGLLGGASALALVSGGASASGSPANEGSGLKPAQSYAELLESIPNAVNTLRAEDQKAANGDSEPYQLAQYYYGYPHHHHHHHHHNYVYRYPRPYYHRYHHHHHHHHHHAVVIPLPQ